MAGVVGVDDPVLFLDRAVLTPGPRARTPPPASSPPGSRDPARPTSGSRGARRAPAPPARHLRRIRWPAPGQPVHEVLLHEERVGRGHVRRAPEEPPIHLRVRARPRDGAVSGQTMARAPTRLGAATLPPAALPSRTGGRRLASCGGGPTSPCVRASRARGQSTPLEWDPASTFALGAAKCAARLPWHDPIRSGFAATTPRMSRRRGEALGIASRAYTIATALRESRQTQLGSTIPGIGRARRAVSMNLSKRRSP